MSEYPEDVMKTARGIVANIRADFTGDGRIDDATAEEEEERVAHAIARAIMAERERCAAVGYWVCAETRHVTLGDKVRGAINQPSSAAPASPGLHPSEQEPDRRPCS